MVVVVARLCLLVVVRSTRFADGGGGRSLPFVDGGSGHSSSFIDGGAGPSLLGVLGPRHHLLMW